MARLLAFARNRFTVLDDPTTDFSGLNVIVTGANVGLGFEAAVKFCALGARKVILGVRDRSKGEAAKTAIEGRTGRKDCVEVWELDMLNYDSIKAFAEKAKSLDHLDIAVLNAGILNTKFEKSKYGWEKTLQVNAISTILLATYLLEKMKIETQSEEGWKPVLEIVSSSMYKTVDQAIYDKEDILAYANDEHDFEGQKQYAKSKAILLYLTTWLANSYGESSNSGIKIVSVCPGAVRSSLSRSFHWALQIIIFIITSIFFRTTEQGARSYVRVVTEGKHGEVWKDGVNDPIQPPITQTRLQEIVKRIKIKEALAKDWPDAKNLLQEFS